MTDTLIWVAYRDSGCYSDWDRVLLGVYPGRDLAMASIAAWHAAHPRREMSWMDDEWDPAPAADDPCRVLTAWEAVPVDPDPMERGLPSPLETWQAKPQSNASVSDELEYYLEAWPLVTETD